MLGNAAAIGTELWAMWTIGLTKVFIFFFKIQAGETVMCKEESAEVQVRMENHRQLQ